MHPRPDRPLERARLTEDEARELVVGGRFWSDERMAFWVHADGVRIGAAALDGLADVAHGGSPVLDLRLAEAHRGHGVGVHVLRALTELVFTRWPDVTRFEGHTREDNQAMRTTFRRAGWVKEAFYRDAWPVDGAPPKSSVAYAVLRRDWKAGTITPIQWDDP